MLAKIYAWTLFYSGGTGKFMHLRSLVVISADRKDKWAGTVGPILGRGIN